MSLKCSTSLFFYFFSLVFVFTKSWVADVHVGHLSYFTHCVTNLTSLNQLIVRNRQVQSISLSCLLKEATFEKTSLLTVYKGHPRSASMPSRSPSCWTCSQILRRRKWGAMHRGETVWVLMIKNKWFFKLWLLSSFSRHNWGSVFPSSCLEAILNFRLCISTN